MVHGFVGSHKNSRDAVDSNSYIFVDIRKATTTKTFTSILGSTSLISKKVSNERLGVNSNRCFQRLEVGSNIN